MDTSAANQRRNRQPNFLLTLGSFLTAVAIVGCSSSSSNNDTTTIPSTFTGVYSSVLSTACIQCHTGAGGTADTSPYTSPLDFSSQGNAYATLVGPHEAGSASTGCSSYYLVVASNENSSFLTAVLFSDYVSNFTGSGCTPYANHLSDQNLSSAEKTAILGWIQNGAQNN